MNTRIFLMTCIFFLMHITGSFSQKPVKLFAPNRAAINSIDISSDGSMVASGGDDNLAVITGFSSGNVIYTLPFNSRVLQVEFSRNGDYLLAASKNEIGLVEIATKKLKMLNYFSSIRNLHFSPQPNVLYVNGVFELNGLKGIFSFDINQNKYSKIMEESDIRDFKVNADGNLLYVMISERILELSLNTLSVTKNFIAPTAFSSMDLFADNNYLGSGTDKGQIIIFNLSDRSNSISTTSLIEPIVVKIGKDNSFIAYNQRSSVKINRLIDNSIADASGNQVKNKKTLSFSSKTISTGDQPVNDLSISPDGKYILTSNRTSRISVWNNPIGEIGTGAQEIAADKKQEQVPQFEINASQKEADLTDDFIYRSNRENIDRELAMKPELFAPKGEFEKTSEYDARKQEAEKLRVSTIDFYRQKYIEQIKLQRYWDSVSVVRKVELKKDRIRSSYIQIALTLQTLGTYDADNELFPVTISGKSGILKMPRNDAMTFKPNYLKARVVGHQQLHEDEKTLDTFNIYVFHPITNQAYLIGTFRQPLYVEDATADMRSLNNVVNIPSGNTNNPAVKPETDNLSEVDKEFIEGLKNRKNYGLFISVANYLDPGINKLDYPNIDGDKLVRTLNTRYGFKLEDCTILKDPTQAEIIDAFDKLAGKVTPTDQVLIFYAGHGTWDDKMQQGYWLPRDAKKDSKAQWISNSTVRDYIRGINSKHTLLIADACFSGGIFKTRDVFNSSVRYAIELYKLPSRKAITSGMMKTVPDQSVFMKYLIKRLNDNQDQIMTSEGLFSGIRDAVINNSTVGQVPQFGEIRESGDEGGDFIFVVE